MRHTDTNTNTDTNTDTDNDNEFFDFHNVNYALNHYVVCGGGGGT